MLRRLKRVEELPTFDIELEDLKSSGIRMVSLVSDPAIEVKGMYFNDQVDMSFKSIKEQMKVVGPAMIPNKKIYRVDDKGNEYFVNFRKDVIVDLVRKFNKENNNRSINFEHTNEMVDAYIEQSWIVEDSTYDKSRMYGFNCPVGTWFVEVKIENKKFWEEEVKNNGRYSFSIEGLLGLKNEYSIDAKMTTTYPNVHENCECEIIDGDWMTGDKCCEYCQELADEHNSSSKYSKLIDSLPDDAIIKFTNDIINQQFVKPNKGEGKTDYISRCMGDSTMNNEYPDEAQRSAICYAYWDNK